MPIAAISDFIRPVLRTHAGPARDVSGAAGQMAPPGSVRTTDERGSAPLFRMQAVFISRHLWLHFQPWQRIQTGS
jgi:hypothetical protein